MPQSVIFCGIYAIKNLLALFVGVQASRNTITTGRCQATCFLLLRNNGSAPSICVIHVVCFYGMPCKLLVVISTVVLVWPAYFGKFEHLGITFQIVFINVVVTKNSFQIQVLHSFDVTCYNSTHGYLGLTLASFSHTFKLSCHALFPFHFLDSAPWCLFLFEENDFGNIFV